MNKHGGYYGTDKKMLDFSVNLNPLGTPRVIKDKMKSLLDGLVNYPEPYGHKAKEAIAKWLYLEESASLVKENVILGNGATELIYLFARCFKPKKVMIIQPTFNEYERAFIQAGSSCSFFQLSDATDFQLNGDALLDAIVKEKPNVLVLCNPNNPTAAYIKSSVIESIVATIDSYNGILFVDESFYEFERRESALPFFAKNVFIIRSMTKYYGIAGLRLGYGIGSNSVIEALEAYKEPWTINTLALEIVPELTAAKAYQDETSAWYSREKEWMRTELERIPFITVYPSTTNFFFCKTAIDAKLLMENLLLKGIYIRTCEDFVGLGQQYIRIALKTREDNEKLIRALKKMEGVMSQKTNEFSIESKELISIIEGIKEPNSSTKIIAKQRLDSLAKPLGSLGKLEDIAIQISAIQECLSPKIHKKCTIVMSSDHGIVDENIACAPAEVTVIQTINMLKQLTGICAISQSNGSDIKVVDIGIKVDVNYPGLIDRKIRYGTANFAKECAMTREEAEKALLVGIHMVRDLVDEGYDLFGTGEMGIGNTSCSSAIYMSFTGESAEIAVGKGGGITDEALALKKRVIGDAVVMHKPNPLDPIDVLSKVGGLDLAGMAGCFLGAAYYKKPIVIDGFISAAAALCAYRINPLVKDYLIPSHMSKEPGYIHIMEEIGLEPMLHLNMRLGEGTGCPMAFSIIETALSVMNTMATFEEAMIVSDYLVDIRA